MTTRIEKDFSFVAALHFDEKFWVNAYSITISAIVEVDSIYEQNVAMDRIEYFILNVLQNSLLIDTQLTTEIKRYKAAGIRVCELPSDAWDQTLGTVLLLKLNAIVEGRFKITDITLSSAMSDGVRYNIVSEVAENLYSGNYWWNKQCPTTEDYKKSKDKNIVKLFYDSEWTDLGFGWKKELAN
jgi:hypothetical protein